MLCTTCALLPLDGQPCWFERNEGKSVHSIRVGTSNATCVCMDEIEWLQSNRTF